MQVGFRLVLTRALPQLAYQLGGRLEHPAPAVLRAVALHEARRLAQLVEHMPDVDGVVRADVPGTETLRLLPPRAHRHLEADQQPVVLGQRVHNALVLVSGEGTTALADRLPQLDPTGWVTGQQPLLRGRLQHAGQHRLRLQRGGRPDPSWTSRRKLAMSLVFRSAGPLLPKRGTMRDSRTARYVVRACSDSSCSSTQWRL